MCGIEIEIWEHIWEECECCEARGCWSVMVERVLGENGEGEMWLKKLERYRERQNTEEESEGRKRVKGGREGEEKGGEGEYLSLSLLFILTWNINTNLRHF